MPTRSRAAFAIIVIAQPEAKPRQSVLELHRLQFLYGQKLFQHFELHYLQNRQKFW
jgi:hypothetical protein